jgi:tetratricopeptide (TPR) repeat protein
MKSIATIILIMLTSLFPALLFGAEKAPGLDPKNRAALAKLAVEKRRALIGLREEDPANRGQPYLGVFISKDGLALISLPSLARKTKPSLWLAGETQLEFGTILGIFPELELSLVKFKHRPQVWLDIAKSEPDVGDSVALVPSEQGNIWKGKIPPVIGPIMVKRSGMTTSLRSTRFRRILSLGASLTPKQRSFLSPGCFAINQGGDLVAFMGGTQEDQYQTLILLRSANNLSGQIEKLAKGGKAIPFPLSAENSLINLDLIDNDFRAMDLALFERDQLKAQRHFEILLKRYPANLDIKLRAPYLMDRNNPSLKLANFPPDPKASKADQIKILAARANICLMKKDFKGAIRELEASTIPKLCPEDFSRQRSMLAGLYYNEGNFDKAEELYRQAYPFNSDSIDFVASFEALLVKQKKFKESSKLGKRDSELSKIYRPR